jgi:hypothetical protein
VSRYSFIVSKANKALIHRWLDRAPNGYRVEIREPTRSDAQNRRLWPTLTEINRQRPKHNGVNMTPELWKAVFMNALGAEMVMLPNLDGDGFFPIGHRSSQLSVSEFSALLEIIHAFAAREGVTLEQEQAA